MAVWLKQSTAVDIGIGPFLDSADGNTVEGSLTLTQPDIRLKKNGGNWAQKSASQTLSHEENGWYELSLSTTDTDTLGILTVAVHESGALQYWERFMVVPANVYDSLIGGSDTLQVDVSQWNNSNVATPDTAGYPKTTIKSGTGTGEVSLSSGLVTLAGVTHTGAVVPSVTTVTGNVNGNVGGNVTGSVGSVSGAVGSVTGAVGSVTGNVGGNVTGSVGSLATQAKADVNAEVVDALNVDAYSEVSAPPAANASLAQKIGWLFALARNKITQSSTTQTLRNDADSSDIGTAAVSDNGTTFTRGEWS